MIRSELDVLPDKVGDSALQAELRSQIDRLLSSISGQIVEGQALDAKVIGQGPTIPAVVAAALGLPDPQ